jgi:hypothetical protein
MSLQSAARWASHVAVGLGGLTACTGRIEDPGSGQVAYGHPVVAPAGGVSQPTSGGDTAHQGPGAGGAPGGAAGMWGSPMAGAPVAATSAGGALVGGTTGNVGGAGGAGGMNAQGGSSAGGAPFTPCEYPPGPYGLDVGDTLKPTLSWQGYDRGGVWRTVTSREMLDCDGSLGVSAIVLRNVAIWCGVCTGMNRQLNELIDEQWRASGVAVYVLLAEDGESNEADDDDTRRYFEEFEPKGWALLTDPEWSFARTAGFGALPFQVVVDPRAMKIEGASTGRVVSPDGLDAVVGRNQ